jgi:hypothetical protein
MANSSMTSRLMMMLLAVCLATSVGAVLASVDTRPEKIRAAEWAEANKATLPDTVDEMRRHPIPYRRAAFKKLTPDVRYALWRDNLQRIASGPLTPEQRAVVLELRDALRPEFYRDDPTGAPAKQAALGPVCKRIGELFPAEQRRLLTTLGPINESRHERMIALVRKAKSLLPAYLVTAEDNDSSRFHDCECAEDTHCLDCPSGQHCGFSDNCSESWFGCGCANAFSCTAMCEPGGA